MQIFSHKKLAIAANFIQKFLLIKNIKKLTFMSKKISYIDKKLKEPLNNF
jgi:hypothetical protein